MISLQQNDFYLDISALLRSGKGRHLKSILDKQIFTKKSEDGKDDDINLLG